MAKNKNSTKGGSKKRTPNTKFSQKKKQESKAIKWLVVAIGVLVVLIVFFSIALLDKGNQQAQRQAPAANMPTIDGMTCDSMEGSVFHIHSHLTILNNGKNVTVPANIGIYPNNSQSCLYWMHTHEDKGEIHMEAPVKKSFTLGYFFDVWKQPLSKTQAASYSDNGKEIKVYVDGKEFVGDPRTIELKSHTQVVLEVGPKFVPPPTTYTFPKGD